MHRKITPFASIVLLLLVLPFVSCEIGKQPLGPTEEEMSRTDMGGDDSLGISPDLVTAASAGGMSIYVTPAVLPAGSDTGAEVRVVVANENTNTPIAGRLVKFGATDGYLLPSQVVTDSAGVAVARFEQQGTGLPRNGTVKVYAWMIAGRDTLRVARNVTLQGLSVVMSPARSNTVLGDTVPVTVWVLDAVGRPVGDALVRLGGTYHTSGLTDGSGMFSTFVTRSVNEAKVRLSASALGDTAIDTVAFWKSIPDVPADQAPVRTLRIFAARSQIRADYSDFTTVTAVYVNGKGNPVVGQRITFAGYLGSSDVPLGVVDSAAVVGADGRATVTLRSEPRNGICRVVAKAENGEDRDSTYVVFTGVALQLVPRKTEAKIGEYVEVEAFLKDGSGNPLGGESVQLTATAGGTFEGGGQSTIAKTGPTGLAVVRVSAAISDSITIRGSAAQSTDSAVIVFDNKTLTLKAGKSGILTGGATTSITATYVDGKGEPIQNAWIVFSANAGTMLTDSVRTNQNGVAVATLRSGDFSATATVEAKAPSGTAEVTVRFYSAEPAKVFLAVTPDNIRTNGGEATLTATVRDSNGNTVNGADVTFSLLAGPGGGEQITKTRVTTQDGVARSALMAGTLPSRYRAVEVAATVGGSMVATVKLTISGEPHIITVSRPEEDTVPVPKSGIVDENTMEMFVGAVVQDINGNPVADGTKVHFSAVVSGMLVATLKLDHWAGVDDADDEIKAALTYAERDIVFEDINNDTMMTEGIDLNLDFNRAVAARGDDVNGDGRFDYNPFAPDYHDFFWDFNGNGICDPGVGEPIYIDKDGTVYPSIFADLNGNGIRDASELVPNPLHPARDSVVVTEYYTKTVDTLPVPVLPASGDFPHWKWEMRPYWLGEPFDFTVNEFAVAVNVEEETKGGVAYATITYPRQLARRLKVTVNAEANGVRDRDGERFVLPLIR